jgi:DNA-binding transcriptional LysR family regulator
VKHFMHHTRTHALRAGLSRHLQCGWLRVSGQGSEHSGAAYRKRPNDAHALDLRTAHHVRVAVPASIGHTLIAPALPRFLEQHRPMRVDLLITEDASKFDRCDAAVFEQPIGAEAQPHARRLATVSHVVCASEEFWSMSGKPQSPLELDPAHCIGLLDEDMKPRSWSFRRGSAEVAIEPAAPVMFSDAQSAVHTAIRGGGIILAPALAVEAQIAAGLLTPLTWEWSAPRYAIWLQHARRPTTQLEAFAEFVAGLFPSQSG